MQVSSRPNEPVTRRGLNVVPFTDANNRRKVSVATTPEGMTPDESRPAETGEGAAATNIMASAQGGAGDSGEATTSTRVDGSGLPAEKFWNLPNTVTMLRIGVVPILLFIPYTLSVSGSRFMAWAFIIAALTDWLDGYLARRNSGRDVTRIGKLLDPLADKLIVSTALIMLLAVERIPIWAAGMVVVIVGRELAVTGLRGIASSHGQVMAAKGPGKIKTIAQSAATAALLFHYETIGLPAHDVGMTLLTIATGLTLWSGYLYFAEYFGWNSAS
jgi:CDP-diacylglycerol--glycerol-3-phosphate 3-phosphatidyltransferase